MGREHLKKLPGPRQPPLYFAGRTAEIGSLREAVATLCASGDPSNGIELLTGVPGAGKTQLANEYAKRVSGEVHSGRTVHVVDIDTHLLNDEVGVFLMLSKALGNAALGEAVAGLDTKTTGHTLGVAGFQAGATVSHGRRTGTLPELLSDSLDAGMWRAKALVVVIDELQSVEAAGMAALRVLHRGAHGCPIQLIGFGLQHTPAVLAAPGDGVAGISRVAKKTALAPLDAAETYDAMAGNLEALGHDFVPPASVQQLADASFGFPRHVHGYLEGADASIAAHGNLQGRALAEALSHGDKKRVEHYNERLQAAKAHGSMFAVTAAMERLGRCSLERDEALAALENDGRDPVDLDVAVAHGVLVADENDYLSFGIPSFHGHMVARLEARARPAGARSSLLRKLRGLPKT